MAALNLIYTFNDREQVMLDCNISSVNPSFDAFLGALFETMSVDEVEHLVKISACQVIKSKSDPLLAVIAKRNGKFYFNTGVNPDDDTRACDALRNAYVLQKAAESSQSSP